jgi:hypothetical protein
MKCVATGLIALMACTTSSIAQSAIVSGTGDQLLGTYAAYIGVDDLYNSQGQRLSQPWQIIRQDRANFHRFGIRDRGDENDSFFASADNRAAMEQMLRQGQISPGAASEIVNGDVFIQVEIYGRGNVGSSVYVTTFR